MKHVLEKQIESNSLERHYECLDGKPNWKTMIKQT